MEGVQGPMLSLQLRSLQIQQQCEMLKTDTGVGWGGICTSVLDDRKEFMKCFEQRQQSQNRQHPGDSENS